jgi:uncharacterized protein YegL
MGTAFSFKTYFNPYIAPTTNSVWGVVSVTANEPAQALSGEATITLICDVSGSMQGAKFNAVVATVEHILAHAPNGVSLGVVVFDNMAHAVLPQVTIRAGTNRTSIVETFRRNIRASKIFGGTSMSVGILAAIEAQRTTNSAARYGIFLTDGQNTEPESQLVEAVRQAAEEGIHLCAYGYGGDWNPDQLTKMAQITQGWQPKAVPKPDDLQKEFFALVSRMVRTVATDVALQLWTPAGARILSLSQAYPNWVKGEAAAVGDGHTWVVPVPPMTAKEHRDFVVHIELANVGAKVVACKPSIAYVAGTERIEEKAEQSNWMILEQTQDLALSSRVDPIVAGYLGQGELANSVRAMTEALATGDIARAEKHRTEALELAQATGNVQMTQVLENAGASSGAADIARKTAALGTSTVSLTEE